MRLQQPIWRLSLLAGACAFGLSACLDTSSERTTPDYGQPPPPPERASVTAFAEGDVSADIRWSDYGVPYITADSLEGIAFGSGYAFARDNACILADQVVRFNSQRSRYFGPDATPGSGDSANLINDFSYKALGLRDHAENGIENMSEESQALLQGYAAGYNKFITDNPAQVPLPCAGQPWVQEIEDVDVLTYALGVALLPGAANFIEPLFAAAPPGESFMPTMAAASSAGSNGMQLTLNAENLAPIGIPDTNPSDLGSNGWGLGSQVTGGAGMLLANPHFPHVGNQRFWQSGIEIPGELKVVGGSLSGFPGLINIGFNENVAWTHTFSTAQRFVVYQLELDESDASGMTYLVDGEPHEIQSRNIEVEVNDGQGGTITLQKTVYDSSFGPMLSIPGQFEWGMDFQGQSSAFAIHDANLPNFDVLDHWLALNLARDIDDVEQSFVNHTGLIFNNIMASDSQGETFFTDGSSVPDLTPEALQVLRTDPVLVATRIQAPFFLVPGNSDIFRPQGTVPFERAPQLRNNEFVQNSNNSYWLTNPDQPIQGDFLLFGRFNNPQSLRSRMGQRKLSELDSPSLADLEATLLSNRAYLAEEVLDDLLSLCAAQGSDPINGVNLTAACNALSQWDVRMNKQSVGAMLFREFAQRFATDPQWEVPFDNSDPLNTPHTLAQNQTTLEHLANAVLLIEGAGLAVDAPLGEVQFVERWLPDGSPDGQRMPWAGANNIEGGFNVFATQGANDGTLLPRHRYPTLPGSQLSEEGGGYHITSGSSWMFVMQFTEEGPEGRGILTYSQSGDFMSPHFRDQTTLYSAGPELRPIPFTESDIEATTIDSLNITLEVGSD